NGVKKDISNFLEMRGDVPEPAPTPDEPQPQDFRRRRLVIFIDNAALHPFARNAVLPHLHKFIEQHFRAGDELTIVTWSPGLTTEVLAKNETAALNVILRRMMMETTTATQIDRDRYQQDLSELIAMYRRLDPPQNPPWDEGIGIIRSHALRLLHEMRTKTEALKSVMTAMRGAEGRKILVLVTQGFASNPAEAMFAYLDSFRESFIGATNVAGDAREFDMPGLIEDIAQTANSCGITLYPIDASGKLTDSESLDAAFSKQVSMARSTQVPQTIGHTLHGIADATGGRALAGSSNFQLAFDTIGNDLTSYYSLGYRSSDERQDRMKSIEVRLKNKKYQLRSRRAVVERTVSTEMSDAVAANLFRPIGTNDLKIVAKAGATGGIGELMMTVPVTITIPTSALTLLPDGSDLTGRFSIFAAFVRNDGTVSKIARQEQQFRFPATSLERRKEITVMLDVWADPQTDGISIGVMDEASHATGFASLKLR
ncbi:MAG TPA: VWA domain-containing protein, partial [Vicinamibacterales bacterium]|nr:VWA domain-containing protein [Vicinamibacterales bacterium]